MSKRPSERLDVWQNRLGFLEAAQRKLPEFGRYLRRYGIRAYDQVHLTRVVRAWQTRFHLPYEWAFECAWTTLKMWDLIPGARQSLQWFAAGRSHDLALEGLTAFKFRIERQFYPDLDFGWFKQSVHGALEAELDGFGMRIGAEDLGLRRRPKNLQRAYECLALRVCKRETPKAISSRREYSKDWTTLWRDVKAASELIGLPLPGRGRPKKNSAE